MRVDKKEGQAPEVRDELDGSSIPCVNIRHTYVDGGLRVMKKEGRYRVREEGSKEEGAR